jgi:hypothetical protein
MQVQINKLKLVNSLEKSSERVLNSSESSIKEIYEKNFDIFAEEIRILTIFDKIKA